MKELKVGVFSVLTLFALVFFLPQTFISTDASAGTADITLSVTTNLTFSLSSHNLTISNLAPGAVANSNIITISTNTNNATGYTLAATVGDASHNTTSLIRSSSTDAFEGLGTSSTLAMNNIPSSKWGFSSDSGLTFSGLPLYTDTPKIIDISSLPVAGGTIDFSIAAHAPTNMPAGTYENVITFSVVANYDTMTLSDAYALAGRTPVSTPSGSYYTMQDMSMDICNNVDTLNSSLQLLDTRDNKLYWVTKLADGNCWMTQNLDYNIKDSGNILSSLDGQTVTRNGTHTDTAGVVACGIRTVGELDTGTIKDDCSYDPGDYYAANGTSTSNLEISCNSSVNDGENCHYHLGNYYSVKAVAERYNLRSSICPQHWRVPTVSTNNTLSSLLGTSIATFAPTYFNFVGTANTALARVSVTGRGVTAKLALDHLFTANVTSTDGLEQRSETSSPTTTSSALYSVRCVAFEPVQTDTVTLSFDLQGGSAVVGSDYESPITITIEEGDSAEFVFTRSVPGISGNQRFSGWKADDGTLYDYIYPSSGGGGGEVYYGNTFSESTEPYFSPKSIVFSEDTTLKATWERCPSVCESII